MVCSCLVRSRAYLPISPLPPILRSCPSFLTPSYRLAAYETELNSYYSGLDPVVLNNLCHLALVTFTLVDHKKDDKPLQGFTDDLPQYAY
ncbi:hypothetical protein JCM11641_000707 [Rhodosporidiobolus odoratus]